VNRRKVVPNPPRITHDRVVELLVDYHLGRLDPVLNRAIELHVSHCPLCQMQGLARAGTEKRVIQRRIRRVKPKRRSVISRRGRILLILLLLIILAQVVVLAVAHSHLPSFLVGLA
jgi:Putative zinc-finger